MLARKIYMNLGVHRETWLLTHQAIAYAQLLGFHRPERVSIRESLEERHQKNQLWLSLCTADVYSSLLLGLPYAGDGRTIHMSPNRYNSTSVFCHSLIHITSDIIDRNQRGLSLSIARTEDIERALNLATSGLSANFWNAPTLLAESKIARDTYLDQISAQCWYYQILVFLYMPLMINSIQDPQLEKYRVACLDASRNLLKTFLIMRSDSQSAFGMVNLIDYQAFVCSALLILGLLGYGASPSGAADGDKDRELVQNAINTLRQASSMVNNPVASQAVQGLETLLMLDSGCPHSNNAVDIPCENPYARIVVPNVGTIIITPGEFFTNRQKSTVVPPSSISASLEFSFSDSTFPETSLPGTIAEPIHSDDLQYGLGSGIDISQPGYQEMASIEFDWMSTLPPNFEGDWAWLIDMNY